MTVFYPKAVDFDGIRTPSPDPWRSDCRTAGIGQKQPFTGTAPKGSLQIRKRTFEPLAAAQDNHLARYVRFVMQNLEFGTRLR